MITYEIHTREEVEGIYLVHANSLEEAKAKFQRRPGRLIDWTGVEQTEYMAYDVVVTDAREALNAR